MIVWTLLLLGACAPHPMPIGAVEIPTGEASVAVVGRSYDADAGAVTAAILRGEVDGIALLGDPVRTPSRRQWDQALDRFGPAAAAGAWVRPLVGEAVSEPNLAGLATAFPGTPPYASVTLGGVDLVFTDASSNPDRHAEQTFWLPRVMGAGRPTVLLVPDGPDADGVIGAALDYAPAGAGPVAVFTVGEASGCAFPGGAYAEARVSVGPLDEGWWRLDLRGGEPTVWFLPVDGEAAGWRYASDVGWRRVP